MSIALADEYEHEFALADWRALTPTHRRQHQVAERDGWTCAYCGRNVICCCHELDGFMTVATLDHRIPRIQGGGHELNNLVLACPSCNSKKGTRPPCVMFG